MQQDQQAEEEEEQEVTILGTSMNLSYRSDKVLMVRNYLALKYLVPSSSSSRCTCSCACTDRVRVCAVGCLARQGTPRPTFETDVVSSPGMTHLIVCNRNYLAVRGVVFFLHLSILLR